jgi:hypothetical protein
MELERNEPTVGTNDGRTWKKDVQDMVVYPNNAPGIEIQHIADAHRVAYENSNIVGRTEVRHIPRKGRCLQQDLRYLFQDVLSNAHDVVAAGAWFFLSRLTAVGLV